MGTAPAISGTAETTSDAWALLAANPTKRMEALKLQSLPGKSVLVRLDLNAPLQFNEATAALEVADASRIRASIPTIVFLAAAGARVVLLSHLGRPKGPDINFSLMPVATVLSKLLADEGVQFMGHLGDCLGQEVQAAVARLENGQVLLLENTRFHNGEEAGDVEFARQLAVGFDIYVNDAFGAAHRSHASVDQVAKNMSVCVPGFVMERELQFLQGMLQNGERPVAAVVGGAKIRDKLGLLTKLSQSLDTLLIGGRMAFTFLAALGVQVSKSQVEWDMVPTARALLDSDGATIVLPNDVVLATLHPPAAAATAPAGPSEAKPAGCCGDASPCGATTEQKEPAAATTSSARPWYDSLQIHGTSPLTPSCCSADAPCIPADIYGVDIGEGTLEAFRSALAGHRTVVWNGPMGVFEHPSFAHGTRAVAQMLAQLTDKGAVTVVAGGDTVAAVEAFSLGERFTHLSTGGGAALELLEGKTLPGLVTLATCC